MTFVTFLTLFDKIQGGSDEWVWGVKSHIFGICQKVFFRHKNENGFLSKLRGGGGGQSNFDICQNFFGFFFEGFPNLIKYLLNQQFSNNF